MRAGKRKDACGCEAATAFQHAHLARFDLQAQGGRRRIARFARIAERERERAPAFGGDLQAALRGVKAVLSARRFWSFSGQAAFFTGGFMALQGLWAVPWLMQVNGYSRAVAADHLFWLNLGMLAGQLSIGAWATRLAARGVTPLRLMQGGLFLTMLVEALIIARLGPTLPLWCLLGIVSATGAQMYGVVAGLFPLHLSGRVTTSINLMAFVGAFAVQWGLGGLLDRLRSGGMGARQGAGRQKRTRTIPEAPRMANHDATGGVSAHLLQARLRLLCGLPPQHRRLRLPMTPAPCAFVPVTRCPPSLSATPPKAFPWIRCWSVCIAATRKPSRATT